jgi:hypothetical protein
MYVTMHDRGEPGADDIIGFTLWNGNELWYSSNWTGIGTEEMYLSGGNLVVHSGFSVGATAETASTDGIKTAQTEVASEAETSSLLVYPNPFTDRLLFEFSSPVTAEARLEVYDATGRLVKVVFDQAVEGGVNYNAEFRPNSNMSNMYFYRLTLGEETYNGKVLYRK